MLNIAVGDGLVGYAALHKEVVRVDDVSRDPRYIAIVIEDVKSELVVPLLLGDPVHTVCSISRVLSSPRSPAVDMSKRAEYPGEPDRRGD